MMCMPSSGSFRRSGSTSVVAPTRQYSHTSSSYRKAIATGSEQMRSAAEAAFLLMDENADGVLSHDELMQGLRRYHLVKQLLDIDEKASSELLETVYANIDLDHSGTVTQQEFIEYFAPSPSTNQPPVPHYDPRTSGITAFLIDLDGTIYEPGRVLPGAKRFYAWLVANKIPHVFLSNTGYKGPSGTQKKLMTPPYAVAKEPVPLDHIRTAADAQVDYMLDVVPPESKIFIVSGGGSFWRDMFASRPGGADKLASWTVVEHLTDFEVKSWAVAAATLRKERDEAPNEAKKDVPRVMIAMFLDHDVERGDPGSSAQGWHFELISQLTILVRNGADFVYTADDPFNSQHDPAFPGQKFAVPGPGMFAALLRPVGPFGMRDQFVICGKGGNIGRDYMIGRAVQMLKDQGHSGAVDTIAMVGDRYGTDVRAAVHIGVKACLVESGCESEAEQRFYPMDRVSFVAAGVSDLCDERAPPPGEEDQDATPH